MGWLRRLPANKRAEDAPPPAAATRVYHNALGSGVTIEDLQHYPYLSFDQGEYNSFHFSEEILSTLSHPKSIRVNDRATLFNLLIGLNGYTISTGVLSADLNGNEIIPVPLECEETIEVGWISHRHIALSKLGAAYVEALHEVIGG